MSGLLWVVAIFAGPSLFVAWALCCAAALGDKDNTP